MKDDPFDGGAIFKCYQGCGTFTRDDCATRYGQLTCPRCKGRGTLQFIPSKIASGEIGGVVIEEHVGETVHLHLLRGTLDRHELRAAARVFLELAERLDTHHHTSVRLHG